MQIEINLSQNKWGKQEAVAVINTLYLGTKKQKRIRDT